MKYRFSLAVIMLACTLSTTYAQFGKIPVETTNAFQAKYPDATNVSWKKRLGSYKTEFDLNKQHFVADFNSNGQWQKTETILPYDKLPVEISDGFHKSLYASWEFTEIARVEEPDKEPVYRIRARKTDFDKKTLYFNTKGQLVKEAIAL